MSEQPAASEGPSTPAGWHQDTRNPGQMRYWDGERWTDHTAPANAPVAGTGTTSPTMTTQPPAKKKRRVFWWFFLAVQILFLIWIIAGASSGSGTPADCGTLDVKTCNNASDAGTAIGVALIVVFWVIVDFLLALIYGIYRLTHRSSWRT